MTTEHDENGVASRDAAGRQLRLHKGGSDRCRAVGLMLVGSVLIVPALFAIDDVVTLAQLICGGGIALTAAGAGMLGASRHPTRRLRGKAHHSPVPLPNNLPSGPVATDRRPGLDRFDRHLSERLEALQDLKWEVVDGQERYRALLDSQADVIVRHLSDGTVTFANRAANEIFDLGANGSVRRVFAPDVLAVELAAPAGVPGRPGIRRHRNEVATRVGRRWFDWEQQEVPGTASDEPEIQLVGRDVTEDRRIEQSLAEARDLAEQANRAKSRFLAAMSHEIRTPMNGILGMTSLLSAMEQTPEEVTYLNAIEKSAHTLLALIDEILDFSKIEAGKLVLRDTPFAFEQSIESSIELLAPRAFEKGLEFAWAFDPDLPTEVRGDEARLRQILLNLVSNAIKFTEVGGVVVTVARAPLENEDNASSPAPRHDGIPVAISVRDSGIGLTENERKSLFREFEQAEHTLGRREGGSGLGLAISQRLAHAMGGEIVVESEPGVGSTFTARVRVKSAGERARSKSSHPSPTLSGIVVLASHRLMERRAMAKILNWHGIETIETVPEDLLEVVRRTDESGQVVARIVFDADLDPTLAESALEASRERSGEAARGVAVLGPGNRSSLPAIRACGADVYLVRPVRPASLLQQILEPGTLAASADTDLAVGVDPGHRTQHSVSFAKNNATVVRAKSHVLLVEDNEINALMARRMVERLGHEVTRLMDGAEAVAHMKAIEAGTSSDPRPDLILMDIFMPGLDGVEATRQINAACATPPPIVALTANAFEEDRQRYLANGMVDYLAKPFELRQIAELLDLWCPAEVARRGVRA